MPTGARLKVMRCVQLKAPEDKRALLDFGLGVGVDLDRQASSSMGRRLRLACVHACMHAAVLPQPPAPIRSLHGRCTLLTAAAPGALVQLQELHGVARLKLGGLLSLKLMPRPMLKLGGAWPLPGRSGLALRLKYEVPLAALGEFWAPPARLMVRCAAGRALAARLSVLEAAAAGPGACMQAEGLCSAGCSCKRAPLRLLLSRCRLDNDVGTGVHLTPTGIEFDERRLTLGDSTEVQSSGACVGAWLLGASICMHALSNSTPSNACRAAVRPCAAPRCALARRCASRARCPSTATTLTPSSSTCTASASRRSGDAVCVPWQQRKRTRGSAGARRTCVQPLP